jgi:hypothetical protein
MSNEELIKELNICRMSQVVMDNTIADLEAKLATCEKYRDAYAECDRIGTQAVRDLEAKLAKALEALENVIGEYDLFRKDEYERGLAPLDDEIHEARATLAEIKGAIHDQPTTES